MTFWVDSQANDLFDTSSFRLYTKGVSKDAEIIVYCLASGSSGNSLLITAGTSALLVDAGLGVRTLKSQLLERGVSPESVSGILLTHEHIDHVRGAVPFARRYNVPLISNSATLTALFAQEKRDAPLQIIPTDSEAGVGSFGVRTAAVSHDAAEPLGFRVCYGDAVLAYATDTGCVTPSFREACRGASLIALESNHDIHKLRFGPYPETLKTRILGSKGHLSNNAACDYVLSHVDEQGPACFWFSHLSETNNTPRMAMNYWKKRYRAAGHRVTPAAIEIALRDVPSLVYRTRSRSVQLALF